MSNKAYKTKLDYILCALFQNHLRKFIHKLLLCMKNEILKCTKMVKFEKITNLIHSVKTCFKGIYIWKKGCRCGQEDKIIPLKSIGG